MTRTAATMENRGHRNRQSHGRFRCTSARNGNATLLMTILAVVLFLTLYNLLSIVNHHKRFDLTMGGVRNVDIEINPDAPQKMAIASDTAAEHKDDKKANGSEAAISTNAMNPDEPQKMAIASDKAAEHKDDKKANDSEAGISTNTNENGATTRKRKWAYAVLVSGAGNGFTYLAGLGSTIAAKQKLRESGSTADFVVMVQMSSKTSKEKLTSYEEELLQKMDIRIVYIPKFAGPEFENFYSGECNTVSVNCFDDIFL